MVGNRGEIEEEVGEEMVIKWRSIPLKVNTARFTSKLTPELQCQ